jgi:hypothetical protein
MVGIASNPKKQAIVERGALSGEIGESGIPLDVPNNY